MRFYPDRLWRKELCTGCGICTLVCPAGAVSMDGKRPLFDPKGCIGCGHCGAWCPENCFGLTPAPFKGECTPETFRELTAIRRSVRRFAPGGISDDELRELLSVVQYCPTGVNAQGIRVVHWRGGAVGTGLVQPLSRFIRRLRFTGLPWLAGILSGEGKYLREIVSGEDPVFRGAPLVLFFYVPRRNPTSFSDGVIAATTVMHQATAMGLGTFWNGVAKVLYPVMSGWHRGAPGGCRLTAVLCVGKPLASPHWMVPGRDWEIVEAGN